VISVRNDKIDARCPGHIQH